MEDGDTSILEAEKVIELSVNKTVTQEKVCQTLARYCQGRVTKNAYKVSHPERYELLKADHIENCSINHKGSAPAMEVAGATTYGKT